MQLIDLREYEKQIERTLTAAEEHQRKKSGLSWEIKCLKGACGDYIKLSVQCFEDSSAGIDYLISKNFSQLLTLTIDKVLEEFEEFKRGCVRMVSADLDLVHFAWLVGLNSKAVRIADICTDQSILAMKVGTKFWNEYQQVVKYFIKGSPYQPKELKLKGYEKYWLPYINLMNAITRNVELSNYIEEIDTAFRKRNNDKRLVNYGFDGDGVNPVHWDLRKTSILLHKGLNP